MFKQSWHEADFHPGSPERRREAESIVGQMVKYLESTVDKLKHFQTLRFLDVHPATNRRVELDAIDARAMAMLFFHSDFLTSEYGISHKESLLLSQKERARFPPKRRPHTSNKYQPKALWEELDTHLKAQYRKYPMEWDIITRPIIAKLYKAGIIRNSYTSTVYIPGYAMAGKTPDGERDLYIDLRITQDAITFPPHIQEPPSREYYISSARRFARDHASARFSVLRLWSAPHFYPLMVGLDRRELSAFTDALGRAWEWNFVPKDMPYSETSIHETARSRIQPFKHLLRDRVVVRRDLYLVMGEDEEDLLKFTTATIFAIQTRPWRLEVDLWRSFMNVDMEFLDSLQAEWLD